MTRTDWLLAILWVVIGAFVGLIVGELTALFLFKGFWVLLVLALPLLIAQLIFEGAIWGGVSLWKRWRGPAEPPEPV